jgi:hypothetical protein
MQIVKNSDNSQSLTFFEIKIKNSKDWGSASY